MFLKDNPVDIKKAKHEMMSKSEWIDYRAKVWFERPAYGKYQGRREDDVTDREADDLGCLQSLLGRGEDNSGCEYATGEVEDRDCPERADCESDDI